MTKTTPQLLFVPTRTFEGSPKHFDAWLLDFKCAVRLSKVTDEQEKVAMLFRSLSPTVQEMLIARCSPKSVMDFAYDELLALLEKHYKVVPIALAEYHKLFTTQQQAGVSPGDFAIQLRTLAATCTWPIDLDRALALVFTMGVQNDKLRQQLLQKDHATLDLALEQANQFNSILKEASRSSHRPTTSSELTSSVNQLRGKSKGMGVINCDRCAGADHKRSDCKYRNSVCRACSKVGHLARACRSTQQSSQNQPTVQTGKRRRRNDNKTHQVTFEMDRVQVLSGSDKMGDNRRFEAELLIEGRSARLEFDTGAAVTIVNTKLWRELGSPRLKKTTIVCRSFTGQKIHVKGEATVNVTYLGNSTCLQMFVVEHGDSVMGRSWIRALGIVNLDGLHSTPPHSEVYQVQEKAAIDQLLNSFPEVFESGLGHCVKVKAHLELKRNVRPIFLRSRPLPYAVYDAATDEIDRLTKEGVLSPIDYSEWAAPVVVVAKPGGKIRLCADFSTGLNDAVDLHKYPLPKSEELFHRLNGGKIFSKLDFSDAYLQVELDEESKKLAVINTHKGLFRYNRLPFGISSAPAIFQQIVERMLTGIPGVGIYLDDVVVTGADEESHNERLRQVLTRIKEYGFKVRKDKCAWGKSSVEYLGFVIDATGRHTSAEKTKAITGMPPPKDLHQLRSFLGLVNHYTQFLPSLSGRLAPLHKLLKKDENGKNVPYVWSTDCQHAFKEIKKDLVSPLMLIHFNPQLPIILAADASPTGVGAVISHRLPDGRELPIAHASKTLTPTESRYPQIEREALALMFGVTKFQQYLWGRRFILRTDHQPLVRIFGSKKGLPTTAVNRLHNYAVKLMSYSFEIEYIPTEKFGQADGLSRLPQGADETFDTSQRVDANLKIVYTERLLETPVKADDIANATKRDAALQLVMKLHRSGWPDHLSSGFNQDNLRPFFRIRHELAIMNSCLLWGLRTIIPMSLRQKVLVQLHTTHPGRNAMLRLARQHVWWPNLDADVAKLVGDCDACSRVLPETPPIPLKQWPLADRPWQRLHVDFAGPFLGAMWFVVVDAHSKWPEVVQMRIGQTTSADVIDALATMFSRYGFAEELVSDNGTQFTSDQFARWCRTHGVKQLFTSPYHPQSNGLAERFVATLKQAMLKSDGEGEEKEIRLLKFLQRYRITPHPTTDQTPAELFLKRTPRSQFDLYFPTAMHAMERARMRDKVHFDKGTKEKKLFKGATVLIRNYKGMGTAKWLRGQIVGRESAVTWNVQADGRDDVWRRHSDQLRLTKSSDRTESAIGPVDGPDLPMTSTASDEVRLGTPAQDESASEDGQPATPATTPRGKPGTPPTSRQDPDSTPRRSTRDRRPPQSFTPE